MERIGALVHDWMLDVVFFFPDCALLARVSILGNVLGLIPGSAASEGSVCVWSCVRFSCEGQ